MPDFEVAITDVTTYGDLYCVAGWDAHRKEMVRPEPPGANAANEASRFWSSEWAGPGKFFDIGNVVRFEADPPPEDFPFPHATEDRIWIKALHSTPIQKLSASELNTAVPVSKNINCAFSGGLEHEPSGKAYVAKDFLGPSLGAILVTPNSLTLYENTYNANKPKLRAKLTENGNQYDLAVTADAARSRWLSANLSALQADINACNQVHVRVGLSRPFPQRPDECYVQINGLYFL